MPAQEAIAFYRLVAAWLLRCVCPSGQPEMPLPEPPPMEFAALPEWFIEDLADLFLYVSRWVVVGAGLLLGLGCWGELGRASPGWWRVLAELCLALIHF